VAVGTPYNAKVVSMSWGGGEFSSEAFYDYHFSVAGVTFTASSGDSGNGVGYPAVSPYVVAVGGTTAHPDSLGNYSSETAWSGSGGGQSGVEAKPLYQTNFGVSSPRRGVPDVAYDADPNTGFPVYDTVKYYGQAGWFQVGGTSAGAPQWAALFAIANSMRAAYSKPTLSSFNSVQYALYNSTWSVNFHDVTAGANGTCGSVCQAGPGYDFVTGLGSPKADQLIPALTAY
jgi:subtilase family serine protease